MNRAASLGFLAARVAVLATTVEAVPPPTDSWESVHVALQVTTPKRSDHRGDPVAAVSASEAGCEEIVCETGFIDENEPDCGAFDDGEDTVNGGCSFPSLLFSPISCGDTYCGTSGASGVAPISEDHDYYRFVLSETTGIHAVLHSDSSFNGPSLTLMSFVNGETCNFLDFVDTTPCGELTLSACLPPGTYALVVRPLLTSTNGCGAAYTLELSCDECRGACCHETPAFAPKTRRLKSVTHWVANGSRVRRAAQSPAPASEPAVTGQRAPALMTPFLWHVRSRVASGLGEYRAAI